MIKAILLDLDDTLLFNDMRAFLPRYFGLLAQFAQAAGYGEYDMVRELLYCTREVIANTDPQVTNREVFWAAFQQRTGAPRSRTEALFDRFYAEQFPLLRSVTSPVPGAADVVRWCQARGWRVVVATNPLFPTTAIEQRLAWAGLPVAEMRFDLVTTFDNMHATKPQPAYYREILAAVGCRPEEALMVGDDWENDVVPASVLNLHAYWITSDATSPPDPDLIVGWGALAQLYDALRRGWLPGDHSLRPAPFSPPNEP